MPYGLTDQAWDDAKVQIRRMLEHSARKQAPMAYSDVSKGLVGVTVDPHYGGTMSHLLGELQDEDHAAGRPLLSALVVTKEDGQPSAGFWRKADSLGYTVGDRDAFWIEQLARLRDFYA